MVKTTRKELGDAYARASMDLFKNHDPLTPRSMGYLFRKHYGLHHRYQKRWFGQEESWIEFPNDADYTAFLLRWS